MEKVIKMKTNTILRFGLGILTGLSVAVATTKAQLPADFPTVTVTKYDTNAVGDGYIFLTVSESSTNVGPYLVIFRNDGTPLWYRRGDGSGWAACADFKVLPNGLLHYAESYHTLSWTGGADVHHRILDSSYTQQEVVATGNGYLPETHEFQLLPNGNALLLSYYQSRMDLSTVASGAYPNALVAGAVIQELNGQRDVVWQWRSWDYYSFPTYYAVPLALGRMLTVRNPVIDSFHVNSIDLDTDGNLLISNFMVDSQKINRRTGEVMWRVGGFGNQFTFVGVPPAQALIHFSTAHAVHRIQNGNILLFCNADQQATRSSAIYEYRLDEPNRVATLVWSYTPSTPWYSWHAGNAQRLPNGNTFIGWGGGGVVPGVGGLTNYPVPACTEVTPSGQVVFEMVFNDPLVASYRAFRFPYPPGSQATNVIQTELSVGNTYDFTGAGLSLTVSSGGGGYNALTARREPYAPVSPLFNGKPPRLLPVRLNLAHSGIPGGLHADVDFDIASLGITDPTNATIYYRATTGQGLFTAQATGFNPLAGKLSVYAEFVPQGNDFGEFVFGYPDVAETPFPPILNAVETYLGSGALEIIAPLRAATGAVYSVNQTLPVLLSWSPKGFASYYEVQVSTNADFSNPNIDLGYTTSAFCVVSNASPDTHYYYRVRTSNDGGVSDWSAGDFLTTAPLLRMKAPNGGEAWRRGIANFIQWSNNLAENVTIDLYKGGVFTRNLATNVSNNGAIKWTIPFTVSPGRDYSIRISSITNSAMSDASDFPFSIVDAPAIDSGSVHTLPDGRLQFNVTAPGAATARVLVSTNLVTWQLLHTLNLTSDNAVFTDDSPATLPGRFYRLSVP